VFNQARPDEDVWVGEGTVPTILNPGHSMKIEWSDLHLERCNRGEEAQGTSWIRDWANHKTRMDSVDKGGKILVHLPRKQYRRVSRPALHVTTDSRSVFLNLSETAAR
jgi:hypothetical protein